MTATAPPRFLLLLPPVPQPITAETRKSIFGETIKEVLKEASSHTADNPGTPVILEIALACEHLVAGQDRATAAASRSSLYDETQRQVAGVYRLVCLLAAEENINVEDRDGVDVRVLLVAWSPKTASPAGTNPNVSGPVVDLVNMAQSGRLWQFAFGVETVEGEAMVKAFVEAKGQNAEEAQSTQDASSDKALAGQGCHFHVAVGGTFDHLHIGHKLLLTMTLFAVDPRPASQGCSATIGITGDQLLVKKKHAELVESWTDRQKAVAGFVAALIDFSPPSAAGAEPRVTLRDAPGPNGKSVDITYPSSGLVVKHTEIQDPFGPTITDEDISALIISAETRSGGGAVNDKRREKGWKALQIFEVDVLDASGRVEDGGTDTPAGFENKLSSTAIREKLARKASGKM